MKNKSTRESIALYVRQAKAEAELNRLVELRKANAAEMLPNELARLANKTVDDDIVRVQAHIAEIKRK